MTKTPKETKIRNIVRLGKIGVEYIERGLATMTVWLRGVSEKRKRGLGMESVLHSAFLQNNDSKSDCIY